MTSQSFDAIEKLPIYERRDDILTSVDQHQVTIITAETGAGKSTQVPQFLAQHGYSKVIVTQPRILAARNLSQRVRQEYSYHLGQDASDLVGYRTAHERDDTPENVILYCTDGLQLVRELTGSGIRTAGDALANLTNASRGQVLVLDEIHEWNENMEVLIAWAKKRCQEDASFRVVLMSATIEAGNLAEYFADSTDTGQPITVAGRAFAVEKRFGQDLVFEILEQLKHGGRNMLVFLPGKAEIQAVAEAIAIKADLHSVPVIPLHSQLEPEQQQLAFGSHVQGKVILTTNVAQTSITIDDIDTVIDSGLERRSEVRNGVEGLFIAQISQADCLQRAGRAGRTKPGLYILAQYDTLPCSPLEEREPYGIPEILRKHIDRLVLRLANINIDIEELQFFHAPSHRTVKQAKRTLKSLGALSSNGDVTAIGRKMERFPVESGYARMLVESEKYPAIIRSKLAVIIAIQEVGGIVKGGPRWTGWRQFTRQTRSDLLAQYDVMLALPRILDADYEELGIIGKNVTKAEEVNERLSHDLGLDRTTTVPLAEEEIEPLLKCVVAGQLHQLWVIEPGGEATNIADMTTREISSGTVVRHSGLVAGIPFDLQVSTPKGLEVLHLVNDVTAVNPLWLAELAPDLFEAKPGKIYYESRFGSLATKTILKYGNRTFETAGVPVMEHTRDNQRRFIELYGAWLHSQLEQERRAMQSANYRRVPAIALKQVQSHVRELSDGAVSLHEMSKQQRIGLAKLGRMETYLDASFLARLRPSHDKSTTSHHHPEGRRWFRRRKR